MVLLTNSLGRPIEIMGVDGKLRPHEGNAGDPCCCTVPRSPCCNYTGPDAVIIDATALAAILAYTGAAGSAGCNQVAVLWDGVFSYMGCTFGFMGLFGLDTASYFGNAAKTRRSDNYVFRNTLTKTSPTVFTMKIVIGGSGGLTVWQGTSSTLLGTYTQTGGSLTLATITVSDAGLSLNCNRTYDPTTLNGLNPATVAATYNLGGDPFSYYPFGPNGGTNYSYSPCSGFPAWDGNLAAIYGIGGGIVGWTQGETPNQKCSGGYFVAAQLYGDCCGIWALSIGSRWTGFKVGGVTPAGTYQTGIANFAGDNCIYVNYLGNNLPTTAVIS